MRQALDHQCQRADQGYRQSAKSDEGQNASNVVPSDAIG